MAPSLVPVTQNVSRHLFVFESSTSSDKHQMDILDRTFSSNSVSESVICLRDGSSHAWMQQLGNLPSRRFFVTSQWAEAALNLKVRRIVVSIISRARGRDGRWTALITDEFGILDGDFRD